MLAGNGDGGDQPRGMQGEKIAEALIESLRGRSGRGAEAENAQLCIEGEERGREGGATVAGDERAADGRGIAEVERRFELQWFPQRASGQDACSSRL